MMSADGVLAQTVAVERPGKQLPAEIPLLNGVLERSGSVLSGAQLIALRDRGRAEPFC